MTPKTVGVIVFDQMAANELGGPAEVFSRARIQTSEDREYRCYEVSTLGIGTSQCVTDCGIIVEPQLDISDAPPLDTLIIPGGAGIHDARLNKKMVKWLTGQAPHIRRIVGLSTGIYTLAATGLLDRREVAVHWRLAQDVARRFHKLRIMSDRLFVKDGPFYTCAGGASAVDLALSLIGEDYGQQITLELARDLLIHLKRSGEQKQFSEALRFQAQSSERFIDMPAWILCNLNEDLSVAALAQKACMSERNFARLFKHTFAITPGEFVTAARIREAQIRLRIPRNTVESVGASVGFKDTDSFSRTFERLVGVRPSTYQGRGSARQCIRLLPYTNTQKRTSSANGQKAA